MSEARPHYQRARREAEKAERREAILAAAGALLRSTGFEGFSMSLLAKKTGIAKGTLYLYFESREDLLWAALRRALVIYGEAMTAHLDDGLSGHAYFRRLLRNKQKFVMEMLDTVISQHSS